MGGRRIEGSKDLPSLMEREDGTRGIKENKNKPHGVVLLLSLNHWRTHVSQPVFVLC
jgi:hypothetical protein